MDRDIAIFGDLHLVDMELGSKVPRSYKNPRFSIDDSFSSALQWIQSNSKRPLTVVINGDFIDFDLIFLGTEVDVATAERKLNQVLGDHRALFEAILRLLADAKTDLVLILGNHDLEFTLMEFRNYFYRRLSELAAELGFKGLDLNEIEKRITLEPWFFYEKDILYVEHGDRFDRYCTSPRFPTLSPNSSFRPPFLSLGSLSKRFILEGLPTFNPFMSEQVIDRLWGYLSHLLRHYLFPPYRLPYRYLKGAIKVFVMALRQRKEYVSDSKANRHEQIVSLGSQKGVPRDEILELCGLGKQSVILTNLFRVFHTLWLDRVCLFCLFATTLLAALAFGETIWLSLALLSVMVLVYWLYGLPWGDKEVLEERTVLHKYARHIGETLRTPFVILSHSHHPEEFVFNGGNRYLNCGSWAPIFEDDQCSKLWQKGRTFVRVSVRNGFINAKLVQWTGEGPVALGAKEG